MTKQTEKQQLQQLLVAMEQLETVAHSLIYDGNGFVLQDRIAGQKSLDEFLLVDWLDESLQDIQFEAKRRIDELV